LYEKNNHKLFHPASNMKLLTTATALDVIDSNFQFTTRVYSDGKIETGILKGNLYIKGSGDPLLTVDDLDSIARVVRKCGIQKIEGDLVGDVTYFDEEFWSPGWMWDDEPYISAPFITPLSVNGNSIELKVFSGVSIGDTVSIKLNPQTDFINIRNKAITSDDPSNPELTVKRIQHENIIVIEGGIIPSSSSQKYSFSVWQPELFFLHLFKNQLIKNGISFNGVIKLGQRPSNVELASYSHPLDSVVFRINKFSDNLAAENLLKTIAAVKCGTPGSTSNGLFIMKEYLSKKGIDTSDVVLADGSGESFYNYLSPDAIVTLLKKQFENKETFPRFIQSLSVAGVDGTLKNRIKGSFAEGRVYAKTGTLSGVSCLSGYAKTEEEKLVAFSILCNHFSGEQSILRDIQDKIIKAIVRAKM
jgi:D-alanyl-D-alanine carboxypeptidase/D-alanyl-D-alanine-endopeptidase (penicillin-binding protein 4)